MKFAGIDLSGLVKTKRTREEWHYDCGRCRYKTTDSDLDNLLDRAAEHERENHRAAYPSPFVLKTSMPERHRFRGMD